MKYKYAVVEWDDTMTSTPWRTLDSARALRPARCRSLGAVIEYSKTVIKLAQSVQLDEAGMDQIMDVITIPRGCVHKIKLLRGIDG